ncbi:hypothetical protein H0H93_006333 [Arthromyces matolae]|nr:hypothetical protein H0H93_006333 [Arthromyces matolae]
MLSGQGTAEPNTVPEMWTLTDSNSVVVSVHEITNYLERTLGCLGLHTEARTSFITFWLPSFLEHGFIALRFLPQAEYSRIAHLDIDPAPDVITRIFMLFQGVKDPKAWPLAQKRALDDVSKWIEIVGVNSSAVFNKDLSRVLEWVTAGFSTFGSLPKFPNIGGAAAVEGWNSDNCGTCWNLTYTNPKGVSKSIAVLAIDHTDSGFNIALEAMNVLTSNQATFLGRVDVTSKQVDASVCGL